MHLTSMVPAAMPARSHSRSSAAGATQLRGDGRRSSQVGGRRPHRRLAELIVDDVRDYLNRFAKSGDAALIFVGEKGAMLKRAGMPRASTS
jgi:hypothetical protein